MSRKKQNLGSPKPKPKPIERLDVEDDEERRLRIQIALEKLNQSTSTPSNVPSTGLSAGLNLNIDSLFLSSEIDRTPHAIPPPTELLSRLQRFLPQLEASNADLLQRAQSDPSSVDIENISEGAERYIEMNLGLGVFEDRSNQNQNQGDVDMSESESDTSSSSDSSDSSDDDSESSSSDDDDDSDSNSNSNSEMDMNSPSTTTTTRHIKPLPKRKHERPEIVELGD